jgi:hypothetical protein
MSLHVRCYLTAAAFGDHAAFTMSSRISTRMFLVPRPRRPTFRRSKAT